MDKQTASKILNRLDSTASTLESLAKAGKLNPKTASDLIHNIDTFADRVQLAAYGKEGFEAFKAKLAKVIVKDPDEKFMDAFDNVNKVLEADADEPFMHKTEKSFNAKAIDNYDADRSSTVSERSEYDVRGLSEWSDGTKKQPSWPAGSAGKSTKQGSSAAPAPKPTKTWAP